MRLYRKTSTPTQFATLRLRHRAYALALLAFAFAFAVPQAKLGNAEATSKLGRQHMSVYTRSTTAPLFHRTSI